MLETIVTLHKQCCNNAVAVSQSKVQCNLFAAHVGWVYAYDNLHASPMHNTVKILKACVYQVLCWCLCMLQWSCNVLFRLMLPKDKGSGFYAMPSHCIQGRWGVSEASMWGKACSTFSWVITDEDVCFICSDTLGIVPSAKSRSWLNMLPIE